MICIAPDGTPVPMARLELADRHIRDSVSTTYTGAIEIAQLSCHRL
jgi:hypothetical protein